MEAEGGVRPATGRVPGEAPLSLAALEPQPAVLTPNADGDRRHRPAVSMTVSKSATLALKLETPAGAPVATIYSARPLPGGSTTVSWHGTLGRSPVPDGRYRLVAEVQGRRRAGRPAGPTLTIDRTLGRLTVTPSLFSPNGDGRRETVAVGFTLARAATVRLRVFAGTKTVATLLTGSATSGRAHGRLERRRRTTADGALRVVAEATTSLGHAHAREALVRDTSRPACTILGRAGAAGGDLRARCGSTRPALLVLRFDGETVSVQDGRRRRARSAARSTSTKVSVVRPGRRRERPHRRSQRALG